MDFEEEQANEIIVLESIYCDEMTILSENPHEFKIEVKYSDYGGNYTKNPPFVVLYFKYTEKYPDEAPIFAIDKIENLPEGAIPCLRNHLEELTEKSLGTVMIYTLVTATQEWLNEYEDNVKKEAELELAKKVQIEADIERKKFEGTTVTKDTFMKWKLTFDIERGCYKCPEETEKPKKLTGRELFLKDISLNESDLKFLEEDGETVKINESLFQSLKNVE